MVRKTRNSHAALNFVQGNILGVAVSGTSQSSSLLHTESVVSSLSGGQYGLEGGWFDFAVTALALGLVLFLPRFGKKKGAPMDGTYGGDDIDNI